MGRHKKKVGFSRTAILGNMDQTKKQAEAETSANVERSTKYRKDKKPIFQKNTLTDYLDDVNEIEEDDDDEVFSETQDINELTRLMSVVDIVDDPEEFEKQLNMAGKYKVYVKKIGVLTLGSLITAYNQFIINLPPKLHPAIQGHLIERFKTLVSFTSHPFLERHPRITPETIEEKLTLLSEKAGVSFNLILAPPTSQCLKVKNSKKKLHIFLVFFL